MDLFNLTNFNQSPDCSLDCSQNYLPLISCDCYGVFWYTYKTIEEILSGNCNAINTCVNTQLGLPNAWSLTNFTSAVVSAYESHIAAGWADPEFSGEVIATLQDASPALVTALLNIINDALLTSPNPLLSNLCAYINDCIDAGLLAVSADAGNLIDTWTDGWALLLDTDIQAVIKHTIQASNGAATLNPDDIINFVLDNTVSDIEVDETVPTFINVKIPTKAPYVKALENPTANTWTPIVHNLNTPVPSLYAYDSANEYIDIERKFVDDNTIEYRTTTNDPFTYYIKS